MKTLITHTALATLLIMFFSIRLAASDTTFRLQEESYVDDIPFDTELIAHQANLPDIFLEEEAYVDDIPFNTAQVTAMVHYEEAISVKFNPEVEDYIDDMPFNTAVIAADIATGMAEELYASGK